jgi:hypothetical protein
LPARSIRIIVSGTNVSGGRDMRQHYAARKQDLHRDRVRGDQRDDASAYTAASHGGCLVSSYFKDVRGSERRRTIARGDQQSTILNYGPCVIPTPCDGRATVNMGDSRIRDGDQSFDMNSSPFCSKLPSAMKFEAAGRWQV